MGGARQAGSYLRVEIPAVRVSPPRVNHLKNSGFERGLEGWAGYNEIGTATDQAYAGRGAARIANAGPPKAIGIAQHTDLLVPPNATVTASCYYKVLRETTLLQWMINTTAWPRFGAGAFIEGKERLLAADWRRASLSITNTTGAPQHVTTVAVISNGFTGDVLLDNFQLELAPQASPYTDLTSVDLRTADRKSALRRASRLRFDLQAARRSCGSRPTPGRLNAQNPRFAGTGTYALRGWMPPDRGWTLAAWCAPEAPPEEESYACLAALQSTRSPTGRRAGTGTPLELRLRLDSQRSDQYGWVGALEVAAADRVSLQMPIALAPGQPLFWALSKDPRGRITLRAAPAGYRLASRTTGPSDHPVEAELPRGSGSRRAAVAYRAPGGAGHALGSTSRRNIPSEVHLGADAAGGHPLNGLVAAGRFVPRVLPDASVEQLRARAAGQDDAAMR